MLHEGTSHFRRGRQQPDVDADAGVIGSAARRCRRVQKAHAQQAHQLDRLAGLLEFAVPRRTSRLHDSISPISCQFGWALRKVGRVKPNENIDQLFNADR